MEERRGGCCGVLDMLVVDGCLDRFGKCAAG